jgi:protein disulfide-isomerase
MKRGFPSLMPGLLALGLVIPLATCTKSEPTPPKASVPWTEDYKAALDTAKKTNKMVFLHFTGSDWCPPCQALEEKVLTTAAFVDWSKDRFILVDLDYPNAKPQSDALKKQNADLHDQYKIEGFPTVILLDTQGKEIAREVGYDGTIAERYIAARDKDIAAAR